MSLAQSFISQLTEHPFHIALELFFAIALGYLVLQRNSRRNAKRNQPKKNWPSVEEQERRLAAFRSAPFHEGDAVTSNLNVPAFRGASEVVGRHGHYITINAPGAEAPSECLDLATYDYHSFATYEEVVQVARNTVNAYGVGSCGPRGFYGTVKPHLVVENDLAKFLETDDAVVYSFSYATIATLISCFSTKGDYLVMDEGASSAVVEGCLLSRSNLTKYAHNDMASLEAQLKAIVAKENALKPKRRFVVTEGVFATTGDICRLPEILALCHKYKFRIILEDSYGFGALGKTGRGTPEHFGIKTMDIDVYVGSLSTSMGAVGGFCAGAMNIVDHQRMCATAYVFSASLPPYVTASVSAELAIMQRDTSFVERLNTNSKAARAAVRAAGLNKEKIRLVEAIDDASPILVLEVTPDYVAKTGAAEVENQLQIVVNQLQDERIAVIRNVFAVDEPVKYCSGLRMVVKSQLSAEELESAVEKVTAAVKAEFS